jgi:hypothetical protein
MPSRNTPYGVVDDLGVHAVPPPGAPADDFEPLDDFEPITEEPSDDDKLLAIFNASYDAPDDHTKALAVAKATGLPVSLVGSQVGAWEKRLRQAGNDVTKFREKNPVLAAAILRKPEVAPAIVKDQSALENLEQSFANDTPVQGDPEMSFKDYLGWLTFKGIGSAGEATSLKARSGQLQSRVEEIAIKQWEGSPVTADELKEADEAELEMAFIRAITPDTGLLAGFPGSVAEQLPRYLRNLGEIGTYAGGSAAVGGLVGAAAGAPFAGVGAVPAGAAGYLAGFTAGMTGGVYKVSSRAEGAMFYREMLKKKVDPAAAYTASQWVSVIGGLLEAAPLDKVLGVSGSVKALVKSNARGVLLDLATHPTVAAALRKYTVKAGEAMATEAATEFLQEVSPIIAENLARGRSVGDSLAAVYDDFFTASYDQSQTKQALVAGAQGGGGMHIASPFTVITAVSDINDARRAEALLKAWETRAEAVQGSEVFAQLKDEGSEIAKGFIAKYGKANAVTVPAQVLGEFFKAEGLSTEDVAKLLPSVAAQMETDDAGAEVVIKTSDFMTHLLTRKGAGALMKDLREGDLPTAGEAPDVEKRATKILEEVAAAEERLIVSNEEISKLEQERQAAQEALAAHEDPELSRLEISKDELARQGREPEIKAYADKRAELSMAVTKIEDKINAAKKVVAAGQRLTAGQRVYADVRTKILALKTKKFKMTPAIASRNAILWRAFVETRAERLRVDPEEYYKGLNLSFQTGEFSDLNKKDQAKALAQNLTPEEEAAAAAKAKEIAAASEGVDYTLYDPAKGIRPLTELGDPNKDKAERKEVERPPVGNPEDFTFVRPDPNAAPTPVPASEAGRAPEEQGLAERIPSATDRELYPLLWLTKEEQEAAHAEFMQDKGATLPMDDDVTLEEIATLFQLDYDDPDVVQSAFKLPDGTIVRTGAYHDSTKLAADLQRALEDGSLEVSDKDEAGKLVSGFAFADQFRSKADIQTLYQEKGARGFFQTNQTRDFFKITLSGKADYSTFIHESGHAFMAILERDAQRHPESAADLAEIKKWLGAGKRVTKDQYEQFARGFEGFVWEGKAPSEKLADVFRSFMGFMRRIYATLRKLNAPLSPEVRNVMDRLLATDMEIQMAREKLGVVPLEDKAGLFTPEEYAAYRAPFVRAYEALKAKADRKTLSAWKETVGAKRDKLVKEVETAAKQNKDLNAREVILNGKRLDGEKPDPALLLGSEGKKLSREAVKESGLDPETVTALSKLTVSGGLDPDLAAMLLGYDTGVDLLNALATTPSVEEWTRAEVDRRMDEEFPGYRNDRAWQQENAHRALHDAEVGNAIWAGMVALSKKLGGKLGDTAKKAIKRAAERRAEEMTLLEMRPSVIERSEARASRDAAEAWKAGDVRTALDANRRQLFYHYLWRNVDEARREVKEITEHFATFKATDKRIRLARGDDRFLKGIEAILATVGYGQEMETSVNLQEIMQALRDEGFPIVLPATLTGKGDFESLSLGELRAIRESIDNLAHLGQEATKAFLDGEKATFGEAVQEIAGSIRQNMQTVLPAGDPGLVPGNLYGWAKIKAKIDSAYWHLKKLEFMARILDGGKTAGLVHRYFIQLLADAEATEHAMFRQVFGELRASFKRLPFMERVRHDHKVPFLGREYAYRDVFMIALNLRNQGNMDRLVNETGWSPTDIVARLDDLLTDEDLAIINKIGVLTESLWPHVVGVYKRTYGIEPKRVTGEKIILPKTGRVLEGGYFPIMKDPRKDRTQPDAQAGALWDEGFVAALVSHGFTENRADNADTPLWLDLDALPHHLMKVIHYVTHYEATRKVDRLIRDPAIVKAIKDSLGHEAYQEIRPWLLNIVHGPDTGAEVVTGWEHALRWGRVGSSVVLMGGKVATAMVQGMGLTMTAKEMSTDENGIAHIFSLKAGKYLSLGAWQFMQDMGAWLTGRGPSPFKAIEAVNSSWILHRENYDRDLRLEYRRLTSALAEFSHASHRVAEMSMYLFNLVQGTVNAISWHAALRKAQEEGHERPNDYANAVIRMSQSSGGAKDLAGIQRGPEWKKIFTVLYSFASVVFNATSEQSPKSATTPQRIANRAAQFWWVILAPAIITTLLRGDEDETDDPEAFFKAVGVEALTFGARSVPLGGEAARATQGWDAKTAPWLDMPLRALKAQGGIMRGEEPTEQDIKDMIKALGVATHLPFGAGINLYDYITQFNDMQEPGMNAFFRPPSKFQ